MPSPIPFNKYHALGNDYIVLTPDEFGEEELTADIIRLICHRNYGIGSDGILYGPFDDPECDFALRIYNPDGSEAEKSGNGLRIFTRYLWDQGAVDSRMVSIKTAGGPVKAQISQQGKIITVDMGQVSFDSCKIPVTGAAREVINETIDLNGQILEYCAATIGNPHCVVLRPEVSADEARKWGPLIETLDLLDEGLEPHKVKKALFWASEEPDYRSDITDTFDIKVKLRKIRHRRKC